MADVPLYDRLRQLDELVRAQGVQISQLQARLSRQGDPRNPRLAITVALSESYPTRAHAYNTYWIRFVDTKHDQKASEPYSPDNEGDWDLTNQERSSGDPTVLATNIHPDPYVPEGTLLKVWWDNNRWWFEYSDRVIRVRLLSTLSAGGSVPCQWQVDDGAGGYEDAPGDPIDVYDDLSTSMTGVVNDIAGAWWDRDSQKYWFLQKKCPPA
ncbi:MAG: hypothetical protein AB7G51_08425 [Steroidobacteraceae bacterium]